MSWRELLTREIEYVYGTADKMFDQVDESRLDWKPDTDNNWMTTAQLVRHAASCCGSCFKGFVTGDWGLPPDMDPSQMTPEDMLPPAEKMPPVAGVAEGKKILADDKKVALDMLGKVSDDDLDNKPAPAPWDPSPMILGHRLLNQIVHLNQHKGQLFYYLKLQSKPVNTKHLWGM